MNTNISIVIPVHNRGYLLRQLLEDLCSTENLSVVGGYEIIVCDDGSTENLSLLVDPLIKTGHPVRFFRLPKSGPAAARNYGVRRAKGDIVVFIDSDVRVSPGAVDLLVSSLLENADWLGAEAALHSIGNSKGPLWDAPFTFVGGGGYHTAGMAYRKKILFEVGGFDEEFKLPACEDVELAVRVLNLGKIGFVKDAIFHHPVRPVNFQTHVRWGKHWRYLLILAVRYKILAFPNKKINTNPRLRVAMSAIFLLPLGRIRDGVKHLSISPTDGLHAIALGGFDFLLGCSIFPSLLLSRIPERLNYLEISHD